MEEQVIKWVNKRGSVHLGPGRSYKRGEVFEAKRSELPKNGFDVIKPVHPIDPVPEIIPIMGFEIREGEKSWYDVVNVKSGKPINAKKLRKEEAELMLANLLEG